MERKPETKTKNRVSGTVQERKHPDVNVTSTEPIDQKILDAPAFLPASEAPAAEEKITTEVILTKSSGFLVTMTNEVVNLPIFLNRSKPIVPTRPWDSPLRTIADCLKPQGVSDENLKAGTLFHSALNFPHTGYPIVVEIMDEGESGSNILNAAINLTSDKHLIEFPEVDPEILIRHRDQLPGKAIVGFNAEGFREAEGMLTQFLLRQYLSVEETFQTKFSQGHHKLEIHGPTGCVIINRSSQDVILKHPSFIRVHLKESIGSGSFSNRIPGMEMSWERIKASLHRLRYHPVNIPFAEQIRTYFNNLKVKHADEKLRTFLRVVSAITVINNPPELLKEELFARVLGIDQGTLSSGSHPNATPPEELVAQKVDYYYAVCLLDDQLPVSDDSLNPRLARIFNTIKQYNLGYLKGNSNTEKDPVKAFLNIFDTKKAWASQEKVFEILGRDGGELPSMPTLYRDLQELLKRDLIREEKDPEAKNKNIYAINVLSVGENIEFPYPSQIDDPVFEKRPVQVINPFTSEIETI